MIFRCMACNKAQYKAGTFRIVLGSSSMVCHACSMIIDVGQDTSSAASILGHSGGSSTSMRKKKASRENGANGGRPKKHNNKGEK